MLLFLAGVAAMFPLSIVWILNAPLSGGSGVILACFVLSVLTILFFDVGLIFV